MKTEIKIPSMGESISEATVANILKPSGSQVAMDDEIVELETEKVNQVLYASQTGTINLNISEGETVKIGQVIGYIDDQGVSKAQTKPETKETAKVETKQAPSQPQPQTPSQATSGARLSKDAAVEQMLSEKKESEKQKIPVAVIAREDKSGRKETRKKMSKIRQVIARRLVEAQQTAAMLTTFNEIDMSEVMSIREKNKDSFMKEHGVKLGFMSFFVKACVIALKEYPGLNSYIDGDEIVHREYYDIGIAVGTEKGLIVPVVRNCDQLSFADIERAIESYARKAKEGTLSPDDLQGGGFTITNGGVYGSLLSTPILNPPQSGILGMHKIVKRPVAIDDQVVIRPMMYVALSYDHRVVDGKEAVSFLVTVKNCLEDHIKLLFKI